MQTWRCWGCDDIEIHGVLSWKWQVATHWQLAIVSGARFRPVSGSFVHGPGHGDNCALAAMRYCACWMHVMYWFGFLCRDAWWRVQKLQMMPGIGDPMTSLYILRTTNAISFQFLKLFQARDKCVIFPWRIQSDSREKPSSRECLEYDTSRDSDYFRFIMSFLSFLLNCCRQPGKISWTLSNITTSVTSTGLDKVARA